MNNLVFAGEEIQEIRSQNSGLSCRRQEHQQPLYVCFVDFKKAFNLVSHERLVSYAGSGLFGTHKSADQTLLQTEGQA